MRLSLPIKVFYDGELAKACSDWPLKSGTMTVLSPRFGSDLTLLGGAYE